MTHPLPPKYRGRTQTFHSRYPFTPYFISKGLAGRKHGGDDYSAPIGTPIVAPVKMENTFTGYMRGYGNLVIAKPNLVRPHQDRLYFAHLDAIGIKGLGKTIHEGQVFAWVGSTGISTGPHLHFEVRRDGRRIDPQIWMEEMSRIVTVTNPIEHLRKRVNAVFRDVYKQQPTASQNEYWLRRIGHKHPLIAINSEAQLKAKMGYYKTNGLTKGGKFW